MIPSLPRSALSRVRDRRATSRRSSCSCSCRSSSSRSSRSTTRTIRRRRGAASRSTGSSAAPRRPHRALRRRAAAEERRRPACVVACWVTVLSVAVGTANAFLLERVDFRGKSALSLLMLAPLVIPGVILGISILAFASRLAQFADDVWGLELDFLRPGPAAGRRRAVLVHRVDRHADDRRAAEALRRRRWRRPRSTSARRAPRCCGR